MLLYCNSSTISLYSLSRVKFLPPTIRFSMSYKVSEKSSLKLPLLRMLATYSSTFFAFLGCSLILSVFINVFLKDYYLVILESITYGVILGCLSNSSWFFFSCISCISFSFTCFTKSCIIFGVLKSAPP